MRISDWSSDVCSSDLILPGSRGGSPVGSASICPMPDVTSPHTVYWPSRKPASSKQMKNCELDRKSVVEGKSVSLRVDLGGRVFIKKKKPHKTQSYQRKHYQIKQATYQITNNHH